MAAEAPLFDRKESAQLRRRVGDIARDALEILAAELKMCRSHPVPETWTRKFKIVADQIRRDFRLDDDPPPPEVKGFAADPLGGLRVVAEDEEVA